MKRLDDRDWSTVGSCAQIGKRVHVSGGVGIGGVLEPLQADPDHRGRLLHRRALGSRRRRDRAQGRGAGDGRLSSAPRPRSSTASPARLHRRGSGFRSSSPAPCRQAATERPARPLDRLRRDHEARRRRTARRPASTNCSRTEARRLRKQNRPSSIRTRRAPPSRRDARALGAQAYPRRRCCRR